MASLTEIDPITLEVIRNRLDSIVREMCEITMRTARSAVMYSGRDFSCALVDRTGQLLALGTSVPAHIFATVWQLRKTLDRFGDDVGPGDIFIGNDPFDGGTHLNDVLIFQPVFHQSQLVAFAVNRAHWYDVGGMVPGSISGGAREIYQEGLRIPPIRLGQNDEINNDVLDLILRNVRVPEETRGDVMAQIASCRIGGQRVLDLVARYGHDTLERHFDEVLNSSERRMRAIINGLPPSTVSHEGYIDNDGVGSEQRRIRVTVTTEHDQLHVDFTGTAPQSRGPLNVGLALAHCFAFIGVKSALDPDGFINSGCFRPIRVTAPEGTMLNATAPAPCGGMGEVGQAAIFVMAALGKLVPHQVSAEEGASGNHQNLAGIERRLEGNQSFIYYDYPPGGGGGRQNKDGLDFVRSLRSGNANMSSIEVLESLFPIIFSRHELRQDSGGPGEFRGGMGAVREYRTLSDGSLSILSDHAIIPPAGLFGGYSGALTRWLLVRDGQAEPVSPEFLSKVTALPVRADDIICSFSSGGGGYGDPLAREPGLVREDLLDDRISNGQAESVYGVVFRSNTTEVDERKTLIWRQELASRQIHLSPKKGGEPQLERGVRLGWASSSLSESGLGEGGLAEVFAVGHPTPLRLRMGFLANLPPDVIVLDSEAWDMLNLTGLERVLWRPLHPK